MEIIIQKNQEAASQAAANAIVKSIQQNPELVIGLASGESPRRLYEILAERENRGEVFFEECTFFSLDEYVGLGENHPASYKRYFEENFFAKLKYRPSRVHTPDGRAADIEGFCRSYEDSIRSAGGIDLQILGIGKDGHLAFNEPGSSLASRTRIKTLTPETLRANKKHFAGGEIPKHVITMGIASILSSKRCLLLAFGEKKSKAVAGMAEGPVTASLPASCLQMHEKTQVYLDTASARLLKRKTYYKFVYQNKPDWQR